MIKKGKMRQIQKKFYAVTNGRKIGVYDDFMIVDRLIRGYPDATYKSFDNYSEAYEYVRENQQCSKGDTSKSQIYREDKLRNKEKRKIATLYCRSCGKPIQSKNSKNKGLCQTCSKIMNKQRGKYKIDKNKFSYNSESAAPQYIYDLLGKDKEFISIDGSKRNPLIHFRCLRCDNDFVIRYDKLKKYIGHDCEALKSSGEAIVEDYLIKKHIPFKTQRNTLRCINPETGSVMPYDFEIEGRLVLIEVQGEQHRKYIKVFHGDEEGFEYQKKKDLYKKAYAEKKGYKLIEIWYEDILDETYKNIIMEAIQ